MIDEFEREVMAMDLMDEFNEVYEVERVEPDWWLVALGQKEASLANYNESVNIYNRFMRFSHGHKENDFHKLVDLFTAALIQNRL